MAARSVTRFFDEALQPAGLRSTQFVVLAGIRAHGELTLPRLASAVSLDRSALTRALRPMEEAGWVRTRQGRTGRAHTVSLTTAGKRLVSKAIPYWGRAQGELTEALAPTPWDRLREGIDEVAAAADRLMSGEEREPRGE